MQRVGITALLVALTATNAPASEKEVARVQALVALAQNKDLQFIARLAALDELGQFKASKDEDIKQKLLTVFADLLKACDVRDYEDNCYRLHVVQAIGNIGSDLGSLAPDLIQYVGSERIVDEAIAGALRKIRAATPAVTPSAIQNPMPAPITPTIR